MSFFPAPFGEGLSFEARAEIIRELSFLPAPPVRITFGANRISVPVEHCFRAASDDALLRTRAFLSILIGRLAEQAGRLEADAFLDRCASKFDEIIDQFEEEVGNVGAEGSGAGVDLLLSEPLDERPRAGGIDADGVLRDPCREAGEGKQGGGIFGTPVDRLHGNSSEWTGLGRLDELTTFGKGAAA